MLVFSGTCQRSVEPSALPFLCRRSSSFRWAFADIGSSAVTTASAAVTSSIIDPEALSQFCCFLPTTFEWINWDFKHGKQTVQPFLKSDKSFTIPFQTKGYSVISLLRNGSETVQNDLCVQVVDQSGRADEAACVLSSLELRLNGGGCSSGDTNRVLLRIKALNAQVHISQVHSGHSVFSCLCDK